MLEYNSPFPRTLLMSLQAGTIQYRYRGILFGKNPIDIGILSMLLWDTKPRTIIEVGSHQGGSALWFRDQLKAFGVDGFIHSVDLVPPPNLDQPQDNIKFYQGDGRDLDAVFSEEWVSQQPRPFLVSEDSDHTAETSLAVLRWFDRYSKRGEYIVVEDGNTNEIHPGSHPCGGPLVGIKTFLDERKDAYVIDNRYCNMFGESVTFFPHGYIRRA